MVAPRTTNKRNNSAACSCLEAAVANSLEPWPATPSTGTECGNAYEGKWRRKCAPEGYKGSSCGVMEDLQSRFWMVQTLSSPDCMAPPSKDDALFLGFLTSCLFRWISQQFLLSSVVFISKYQNTKTGISSSGAGWGDNAARRLLWGVQERCWGQSQPSRKVTGVPRPWASPWHLNSPPIAHFLEELCPLMLGPWDLRLILDLPPLRFMSITVFIKMPNLRENFLSSHAANGEHVLKLVEVWSLVSCWPNWQRRENFTEIQKYFPSYFIAICIPEYMHLIIPMYTWWAYFRGPDDPWYSPPCAVPPSDLGFWFDLASGCQKAWPRLDKSMQVGLIFLGHPLLQCWASGKEIQLPIWENGHMERKDVQAAPSQVKKPSWIFQPHQTLLPSPAELSPDCQVMGNNQLSLFQFSKL